MKRPIALLLTAFTGLSFAALAQEAPPILPEPGSPVARDTQTAPRRIGIDPLPVEERPSSDDTRGDMPAGAVSFEDILPDAASSDEAPFYAEPSVADPTVPDNTVIAPTERLARPPVNAPLDADVDSGPGREAASAPAAAGSVDPGDRFAPCPVDLLKDAYARMLGDTVLQTYAIEAEVVRLCAERQARINRILQLEAELEQILTAGSRQQPEETVERQEDLTGVGEAALLPRDPVAVPGSSEGPPDDAAASVPDVSVTAAPDPVVGSAAASPSPAGSWQHLVRYRVRVAGGAWRAGIASTYRPPLPPPVVLEDGTLMPVTPLAPEPPLELVVAAGDRLEDGLIVEAITDEAVMVRGDGDDGEPRPLRNDPGPAPARAQDNAGCTADNADPREFVYCTVAAGNPSGAAAQ